MSIQPIYKSGQTQKPEKEFNKGLWFGRFFQHYQQGWEITDSSKREAIREVTGGCGQQGEITAHCERLLTLVNHQKGQGKVFKLDWHFVTGMGNAHPVENGFTWHHTLGTPYIPGSTVKGLLRAWMEVYEEPDAAILKQWFGSEHKDPQVHNGDVTTGGLVFFDAIPASQPTLACDIMTPHMGKWYEKGGEEKHSASNTPGDWHSPVPVPFLVTKQASFLFSVAARSPEFQALVEPAMEKLQMALLWLGVGSKTAVGYGHMEIDEAEDKKLRSRVEEAIEQKKDQQRKAEMTEQQLQVEKLKQLINQDDASGRNNPGSSESYQVLKDIIQGQFENWSKDDLVQLKDALEKCFALIFGTDKKSWKRRDKFKLRSTLNSKVEPVS